ncbi:MAG: histidinol phosphate aminotransferase [Bacteroidetes bacterium MedPE-SWsnd-G1]|nr:MAG: histidinol phosphate aminotransferase [Bacteroidetes bacterium MedPE-SWsnd-G1]
MRKSNQVSRRNWLKTGGLSLAAMALMPNDIWATNVSEAQFKNNKYLFDIENSLNEFTPPIEPVELPLKAILRANENPYGPSKLAIKAFQEETFKGNRYAWKTLSNLMDKIAKKENVTKDQILMGPGSSDILEKIAMVFFQNGGNVVSADPSYMSLIKVSEAVGGNWKAIKLLPDSSHDLEKMEAAIDSETKLVYICNPNNPTGSITDANKLKDFCSRISEKVPVFVDEAYIELANNGLKDSMVDLVSQGKNIIVARTFSKIHGMAGLRIGYMVTSKEIMDKITPITRGGMGITGPSIVAATTSMDDVDFLKTTKSKITEAREYTYKYLNSKNYVSLPSQTNFIIFEIPMEGDEFLKKIYAKRVGVRAFKFWDKNWCRVSIGTMDEMKLFTGAMDEIFA